MAMHKTERTGLVIAIFAHAAIVAALSIGLARRNDLTPPSKRITVQIADEVGLTSTSPTPFAVPAPDVAPEIGEAPPPPDTGEPSPAPTPSPVSSSAPVPSPAPSPSPKAAPKPAPAARKPSAKPAPKPTPAPAATPKADEPKKEAAAPRRYDSSARRRPDAPSGGSRLGANFLEGVSDQASTSTSRTPPAEKAGPAVLASLERELLRQVKPHWRPPTGADAEKLRTKVTARLDRSGNIIGQPQAVTTGETASNANQVSLHRERAIAAVRQGAPYNFPDQYYDAWSTIEPVLYLGL